MTQTQQIKQRLLSKGYITIRDIELGNINSAYSVIKKAVEELVSEGYRVVSSWDFAIDSSKRYKIWGLVR
jgi:hypothetical protein